MNSRERFYATINGEKVDQPASWLGLPEHNAIPGLLKHFRVNSMEDLKYKINDDIWPVEVPYSLGPAQNIGCALPFAKEAPGGENEERTLTAPGFFEDYDNPSDVDKFDWPDPKKYINPEESLRRAQAVPKDKIRMGIMWSAHFQDACSAFGMEKALMTMMLNPEMFQAVINRIVEFYLEANEIFYEATKGELDAVLIGNDFGSQTSLMVDPDSLRSQVFNGTRKLVEQAKSYGLKVVHHSCGSIFPIIEDLKELGVDVIHPIQALAADMSVEHLKESFDNKVSFCGGVDAQELLVNGSAAEVYKRVQEIKKLYPTGLVISPSHEAILPDIPPANIEALFNSVKEQQF